MTSSESQEFKVYSKVGRGGAGNFYSRQDVERSLGPGASDLEAQSSPPASSSLISQDLRGVSTSGPRPGYQHMYIGRGGAGNLSAGLPQTSTCTHSSDPSVNPASLSSSERSVKASVQRQSVVYKGGRGGAGNYYLEEGEGRILEEGRRRREEEIGRLVLGEVDGVGVGEGCLKRPGRVYDGGAGKEVEMEMGSGSGSGKGVGLGGGLG
ncbi:hypothetical protein DSL72_000138 [Monilinia vaccinii-corymbosi]|uniref:Uncharacterized protein n=1 Tax=Monilinia vaccinii-corymbosi TaxID=61207 RepID=A0A8A3P0V9_9HELO|nr:hypothetical protein DSL72_000138 [Monilinia vaccinii-corymbosi]